MSSARRCVSALVVLACLLAPSARAAGEASERQDQGAGAAPPPTPAPEGAKSPFPAQEAKSAEAKPPPPWRLNTALSLPPWLRLSGTQRTRYEGLWNTFRAGFTGDDDVTALRTTFRADLIFSPIEVTGELMDSRMYGVDTTPTDNTPLDTTMVNAVEIIQAFLGLRLDDMFGGKNEGFLLAGRHTMDVGSRRLIARNAYRNTTNNFTGLNATYQTDSGSFVRAFGTSPMNRLPSAYDELADNDIFGDEPLDGTRFYGVFASQKKIVGNVNGELYWYLLDEEDATDEPTRDRSLNTPGFRLFKDPTEREFDFEIEAAYQFGTSVSSTSASNTTVLDNSAYFTHLGIGYSFEAKWSPRLLLQFDYASGDRDPNDDENNRFDTLYGARRWEYGPTGIFGPFARANLITPGMALYLKPMKHVELMLADRFYWLASDTDAWVPANVVDPTGQSGSYLGNMPEISVRWSIVPQNVVLETGFCYLFNGGFAENAPNATGQGDTAYVYVQTQLSF